MEGRLRGKIAIVAGGGSGIGAASARRLAAEGALVVVGDIAANNATSVANEIHAAGGSAMAVEFDISEDDSVRELVATTLTRFGGLDHIHVNAADLTITRRDTDAVTIPLEVFDRTIAVNLRGHLLCARHAVPQMLKRGGGALVFTSSGASTAAEPTRVAYAVGKAGLEALVRHIASAWGRHGIRANAVAPGMVLSDYVKQNLSEERLAFALGRTRSTRLGDPTDLGAAVAFLMSCDGEWINGQVLAINGGSIMR
jgi:NAD(P)-dependent dehydrogenase (short-subunit alcohol dehydrogenase family)